MSSFSFNQVSVRHITFGGNSRLRTSASKSLKCFFKERTFTCSMEIGSEDLSHEDLTDLGSFTLQFSAGEMPLKIKTVFTFETGSLVHNHLHTDPLSSE